MSLLRPIFGNEFAHLHSYQRTPQSFSGTGMPSNPYPGLEYNAFNSSVAPALQTPYSSFGGSGGPGYNGGGANGGNAGAFGGGAGGGGSGTWYGGGGSPAVGGSKTSGPFNIGQIKQIIDKLGGIEGITDTMNKVQRMVAGFQQIAPLVKVLMGSFRKNKKTGLAHDRPGPRRRKRGKGKGSAVKNRQGRRTVRR